MLNCFFSLSFYLTQNICCTIQTIHNSISWLGMLLTESTFSHSNAQEKSHHGDKCDPFILWVCDSHVTYREIIRCRMWHRAGWKSSKVTVHSAWNTITVYTGYAHARTHTYAMQKDTWGIQFPWWQEQRWFSEGWLTCHWSNWYEC